MKFKKFGLSKVFGVLSVLLMIFAFSCDVGLGSAVDVEPPSAKITYPPESSVIKDYFVLEGTCEDDQEVKNVYVTVKKVVSDEDNNTVTKTVSQSLPAVVKDNAWSITLNQKNSDGSFPYSDGKYSIEVVAIDTSNRSSTGFVRTFEIDNTAPVFIIKNPGSLSTENPTAYGSVFKVTGTIADDHEISRMTVKIFDKDGNEKTSWEESNVETAGGTEVVFARYNKDAQTGADALNDRFNELYGESSGQQDFKCAVYVSDSAKTYQGSKSASVENDGNTTSALFLNADVYESLMGKTSEKELSASDFKKILNGTYSESSSNSTARSVTDDEIEKYRQILVEKFTETTQKNLSFSLNKTANPKYSIAGYAFDSEEDSILKNKASKKGKVTLKVAYGLDQTNFKSNTIKAYLFGPYEKDSLTEEKINSIYLYTEKQYESEKEQGKAVILLDNTSQTDSEIQSLDNYTESLTLPDIITRGKYYIFAATGSDEDGVEFLSDGFYGFTGESAGTAPSVAVTGFSDGKMVNSEAKLELSGTLSSEETELSGVEYKISVQDEIKSSQAVAQISGTAVLSFTDDEKLSATWKISDFSKGTVVLEDGYSSCVPASGERFKYSLTVTGLDSTGLYSRDTKSFIIDKKSPEIKINECTPVAKKETSTVEGGGETTKYIVNGKIKFSAVVTDTNLANVKVTASDGTTTKELYNGESSTIEKEFDTTEFADEKLLTFTVVASDTAENENTETVSNVYVSQQTDKPEIKFTNGKTKDGGVDSWAKATNGQNVFGIENNNSANFSITDDDGLSSIKLTIYDENEKVVGPDGAVSVADAQLQPQTSSKNAAEEAQNPVEYEVDGSTSYSVSYVLPKKAGKYKILLDVLDSGYASASTTNKKWHTTTVESYILVSEGNFSISLTKATNTDNNDFAISNNETLVKAAADTTISGAINLSSIDKLENIERYAMKSEIKEGETTWNTDGTAQAKYKLSEGETLSNITARAENGKIIWTDTIPSESIKDGVQHFYYKATAVAGTSSSVELVLKADGTVPKLLKDTSVLEDDKWVSSSSATLSMIVADLIGASSGSEASGIEKVTYSYSSGDNTVSGELARGKACDSNGNESASEKNYYKYSTTINDLSDTNSLPISFNAEDKVGNKAESVIHTLKVDTKSPEKTELKIDPKLYKKNTDKVQVSYAFSDATGGISKIEFCTDNKFSNSNTHKTISSASDSTDFTAGVKDYGTAESLRTIDIPLTDLKDGEYKIYARVTDVAGNVSEIFETENSVTVDNTAPVVKITSHTKAGTEKNSQSGLNNKVTFSGTILDNNIENSSTPVIKVYDNAWKEIKVISSTCDGQTWTAVFDTAVSPLAGMKGTYAFQVAFTDKAGNTNLITEAPAGDYEYCFYVDIDADRPIITFSDIGNFEGSVISRSSFKGFVSDDDGDVKGMWYIPTSSYAASKLPSTSSDNGWKKISVAATTGDWEITLENEGENSFEFFVIDSAETTFCTKNASGTRPILKAGKNEQLEAQSIKFTYDKTPPVVKVSYAHGTSSTAGSDFGTTNSVFGTSEYLYVKAVVTEAVGLADSPLTLELGGTAKDVTFTLKNTASPYEYVSSGLKIEGMPSGSVQIAVTAKDKAGLEGKGIEQITVDTEAPVIKIVSPTTSVSDAITGAVTIKGIAQDSSSSISRIQYMIPTVDQKSLYDKNGSISSGWKEAGNSNSWEIQFASGAKESSDSLLYYVEAEEDGKKVYAVESYGAENENLWKVPLYFRVKDSCGNEAIRTKDSSGNELYVVVDPDGGKPKVWINSPEEGTTTSGLVTIYGGASDDVSVAEVHIQIDANGDGKFDEDDYSLLSSTNGSWVGTEAQVNLKGSSSDWYILANGTNSWKRAINTEQISKSPDGKTYLRFRASSYDYGDNGGLGTTRGWSNVVTVNIDSEVPVIKDLKVVQFGANVTTADSSTVDSLTSVTEREYISGMYISNIMAEANGTFYLVGTISDNEMVKTVTFEKQTTSSSLNNIDLRLADVTNDGASYKLCIPLKTEESGQINYVIKAKDGNTGETSQSVVINIDSTKPGMYKTGGAESTEIRTDLRLKSQGKNLGTGSNNSTVVNSNNYFTFGDTVSEAGSGLAYIVATFERSGSVDGKRIYNPMKSNTKLSLASSETESSTSSKPYISSEGFAIQTFNVTREDEYSIKSEKFNDSSTAAFIQKGGLVRIAGTYCLITGFDSSAGKITLSKSVSTSFTKAELIFGQVIDHQIIETQNSDGTVTNDDGDGMCETISQLGSSYNWTASIKSDNIPDGPLTIHVVAIDNAGNINYGSIATKVENNRPRIAKVMLATDLNGNGAFDYDASSAPETGLENDTVNSRTADGAAFGEFSFYSAMTEKTIDLKSEVELKSGSFKVLGELAVLPEFVGGNGDIGYILKQNSSDSSEDYTAKATGTVTQLTPKNTLKNGNKFKDKSTNPSGVTYEDLISDKGGIVLDSVSDGYLSFTFWDSTEETTQGTDSQWAHLKIPVTVLSSELEKPVPAISPFYWENKTENSVYATDGTLLGHIELEGDLTSEIMSAYGDTSAKKKPKVSGKIKIEGTITDNVRIASISMSFDDLFSSTKLADYTSGSWQTVSSLPNGVVSFVAEDVSISQGGHEAKYTLVVDTEKLTDVAGKDKNITISATDWKNNTSVAGTVQTTASAKTALYKVDVVPYVTGIGTELSAFYRSASTVYSRTSTGRYPLHENESITFYGFNLGSPSVSLNGTELSTGGTEVSLSDIVSGANKATRTTGTTAKSGAFTVTVNSLQAINNMNNNNKEYNQQPNNVNNNILTDDLYADVWQFKNAAEPINGRALGVTMKIDPKNGIPGFSYANAILFFNMPGYLSNQSSGAWRASSGMGEGSYSQIPFGMNYGGFINGTFCYDAAGYSYGIAMCTDTSKDKESAFFQFFSREAALPISSMNQNLNYANGPNYSRLDSSSVQVKNGDSGWVTDTDRIQSPSIEATVNGGGVPTDSTPAYVFMAYYDMSVKQVRFRWGTVGGESDEIDGKRTKSDSTGNESWSISTHLNNAYGLSDIVDDKYTGAAQGDAGDVNTRPSACDDSYIKYSNSKNSGIPIQIIAASGISGGINGYDKVINGGAGEYVSLSIVNKNKTNPVAVVSWYDAVNRKLKMAYNENPTTSSKWTTTVIDENGGINVKTAVDDDGGIHFAYYDNMNGSDLKYAYLSNYKAMNAEVVVIDSYGAVGAKPTIDVAKDKDGNWVPYISYQLNGYLGTSLGAKLAYRTDFSTMTIPAGSDDFDCYTGKWECSIIPSINIPNDDYINVGLFKDANGVIKNFPIGNDILPGSSLSTGVMSVCNPTKLYGNGTSNPIIGYGIDTGAIEMAQKK